MYYIKKLAPHGYESWLIEEWVKVPEGAELIKTKAELNKIEAKFNKEDDDTILNQIKEAELTDDLNATIVNIYIPGKSAKQIAAEYLKDDLIAFAKLNKVKYKKGSKIMLEVDIAQNIIDHFNS